MGEFNEWQDRIGERIRSMDGVDLRRARIRSPAARWITYSVGASLAMTLAHERRHLWQARRVRNELKGGVRASGFRLWLRGPDGPEPPA
jgi:hypothetical protein